MTSKRRYLGFGFDRDEATGELNPLLPVSVVAKNREDAIFKIKARYERINGGEMPRLQMKVYSADFQEAGLLA